LRDHLEAASETISNFRRLLSSDVPTKKAKKKSSFQNAKKAQSCPKSLAKVSSDGMASNKALNDVATCSPVLPKHSFLDGGVQVKPSGDALLNFAPAQTGGVKNSVKSMLRRPQCRGHT
jgi:hypothetical protein